ncbi:MerR family transcriptional regulator [Nocardioides aestuarii]|uniref:MerR family transcriptional regulator n=1 Tax=Nocardioides aestuarii TaxID=252231 RepID=A0ABW4TN88_9ACTN
MLTIGQLASYAGVTVRAVRHYHHVGLLPEPARDHSGYRSYDAAAVVRLVRIRTLAEAGVPLARVEELLDADPDDFAAAVAEIDQRLRAEVQALQEHRRRIAALAAGDSLALPPEVVAYLDRLRTLGVAEEMVLGERDGWILMAARWPDRIPEFMVDKQQRLDDPRTVRLYLLIGELAQEGYDEERLVEVADLMVELTEESERDGELELAEEEMGDDAFIAVMDAFATDAHPMVARLQELMAERGWTGWSNMQRSGT